MRKSSLILLTLLALTFSLVNASQRYLAFEVFTETW